MLHPTLPMDGGPHGWRVGKLKAKTVDPPASSMRVAFDGGHRGIARPRAAAVRGRRTAFAGLLRFIECHWLRPPVRCRRIRRPADRFQDRRPIPVETVACLAHGNDAGSADSCKRQSVPVNRSARASICSFCFPPRFSCETARHEALNPARRTLQLSSTPICTWDGPQPIRHKS